MKKVYTYLAALAAAALVVFSCQPLPEDLSHVDEIVKAPAVTISVSEITDYTATVTISPAGAANYYAYVVDQSDSDDSASLDAASLYANKYSSVANGLVKYATEASKTVELEDLDPNSVYQVYAVAGSTTGVVGTISVASFTTTDKGTPAPSDISKKDNVLQVKFSEAVVYKSDKPATAYYYAYNTAVIDKSNEQNPVLVDNGMVGEANVAVAVNGSVATFTVTLDGTNPLPDGAYFTVGYPAGAFEDVVGNPAPARTHLTGLTSDGTLGFGGFYNRMPTKAFDLEYDKERAVVVPSETMFAFALPETVSFYQLTKAAKATMVVDKTSASKTSTTTYTLEKNDCWGYAGALGAVIMFYPADIDIKGGDYVTFGIDAGSVEDIYGNTNSALNLTYLYSFNYKLEEVYGTYKFTCNWYNHGEFENDEVIIAPREPFEDEEDEEYYKDRNVAIYNLFKVNPAIETLTSYVNLNSVHYATFDIHTGIMNVEYEVDGVGTLAAYDWEDMIFIIDYTNYDNYNFFQAEKGTITLQDDLRIYLNNLGTWGYYDAGATLVKISDDYTIPVEEESKACASVSFAVGKAIQKTNKNFVTK